MAHQTGTIVLTGANGGLGSAMVSRIVTDENLSASHGIYTVRDTRSPGALQAALNKASSSSSSTSVHSHEEISLDLSRLDNVRKVAAVINAQVEAGTIPPIRAIILNAGFEEADQQTWNEDGLDMSFVVNYLGHWLLTVLLLQSMDRERGRIVWISSWSQDPKNSHNQRYGAYKEERYKNMVLDDLEPLAKGTWSSKADDKTNWAAAYRRYGASKMCCVAMIHELQKRLDQDPVLKNISVLAIDPGGMDTGIIRHSPWLVRVLFFKIFVGLFSGLMVRRKPNGTWRTPKKSARDVLAAALASGPPPLSERPKGVYLNGTVLGEYNLEAKDPKKGQIIWEGSVRFAQLREVETALQNWR
ncbi:hypothetical protein PFICI_04556 [Pestalotiopsis fici W106-1]|uniref:3beta-hydroxysteroid 3-dehydrogenase n=1 Tax=Pestalotiopsis fici (strain W106-1 / CGMCC3.15140) TaxID=1229662 RepID=W3X9E3_PESFW|nr:uncharacterized protein PFICI_04556 [Pestalotiopsis fici W106-1]ETS82680.1 hypothetical protein PFICI_04556 [Pestalotiopsis fici W106-1]